MVSTRAPLESRGKLLSIRTLIVVISLKIFDGTSEAWEVIDFAGQ